MISYDIISYQWYHIIVDVIPNFRLFSHFQSVDRDTTRWNRSTAIGWNTLTTFSSVSNVSGTTVPITTQIRLLGVTLDQSLSLSSHASQLSLNPVSTTSEPSATFGQFWVKTQPISSPALLFLPGWTMQMHVCSASVKNLSRIQRIQNTLARVVACSRSWSSSAPLLKHLHWLPVSARTHFKIALLTFKSLHTIAPSYLSSLIRPDVPSRALRSSSAQRICVPHVSSVFGSRGFRSGWSSNLGIPYHSQLLPASPFILSRKQLKTHLFASASPSSWIIVFDAPLIRLSIIFTKCLLPGGNER